MNEHPVADAQPSFVDPADARLMRVATVASTATAVLLILVKFVAWVATGSLALMGSLVDSALDAAASLVNLMAVRQALQPADRDHRFGHGKAESVAGLAQSAFIGGSAVFLAMEAVQRLASPRAVANDAAGLGVMAFAMAATGALVTFQRHVVRRTHSLAISADLAHYIGDILVNGSVIVAFLLNRLMGWVWVDAIFALGISAYLAWNAWSVGNTAFDQLMDREMAEEERERICRLVLEDAGSLALHDLRTRISGPRTFIQLHLEVDGRMSLCDAHRIAERVETLLMRTYPASEVIVHLDPVGDFADIGKAPVDDRQVSPN